MEATEAVSEAATERALVKVATVKEAMIRASTVKVVTAKGQALRVASMGLGLLYRDSRSPRMVSRITSFSRPEETSRR